MTKKQKDFITVVKMLGFAPLFLEGDESRYEFTKYFSCTEYVNEELGINIDLPDHTIEGLIQSIINVGKEEGQSEHKNFIKHQALTFLDSLGLSVGQLK